MVLERLNSRLIIQLREICGNSSVGRAQPCQGWGREFEPRFPLTKKHPFFKGCFFFVPFCLVLRCYCLCENASQVKVVQVVKNVYLCRSKSEVSCGCCGVCLDVLFLLCFDFFAQAFVRKLLAF